MAMNHGSSAMDMAVSTAMSVAAAATTEMSMPSVTSGMSGMSGMAATSTAKPAMSMGGMGNGCKISMLWNWNTVDSCFISSSWKIKSAGMMAGSCIGVILLVMTLELFRRASKEYDRYLIRTALASQSSIAPSSSTYSSDNKVDSTSKTAGVDVASAEAAPVRRSVRPTILQQAVRASLHMVQFTIAYFVMLLAMYYNGYLIISIIIGAWLGSFVFSWESLDLGGPKEDSTYCCG